MDRYLALGPIHWRFALGRMGLERDRETLKSGGRIIRFREVHAEERAKAGECSRRARAAITCTCTVRCVKRIQYEDSGPDIEEGACQQQGHVGSVLARLRRPGFFTPNPIDEYDEFTPTATS